MYVHKDMHMRYSSRRSVLDDTSSLGGNTAAISEHPIVPMKVCHVVSSLRILECIEWFLRRVGNNKAMSAVHGA
jgi:hypothetical protein